MIHMIAVEDCPTLTIREINLFKAGGIGSRDYGILIKHVFVIFSIIKVQRRSSREGCDFDRTKMFLDLRL